MRAVRVEADQSLSVVDVADPVVGSSDVLIEVRASGLNRADLAQRAGNYPPPPGASEVLGLEVAGTVREVGEDVADWQPGDSVCALLAGGGYAELAVADEGSVFPVPEGMDFVEAACLPEAMMTVWANVFLRSGLQPGESFLVHGGTSGIGVMAIQMARHAGASSVFATAGTPDKVQLCRDLGADYGIDYRNEDFVEVVQEAGGVDVILDMVGGDYIQRNISSANLNGRICNIAYQSGFEATVNFGLVLMKRLTLTATTLRARTATEKRRIRDAVLADFWPAVADGTIRTVVDSVHPLDRVEAAHTRMESGEHAGKIVLSDNEREGTARS